MKSCCFFALLISVTLFHLEGCQPEQPPYTAVSVLCDVSEHAFNDSAIYKKDIAALTQMIAHGPLKQGNGGGQLRMSALNELSQNNAHIATLPSPDASILGINPYVRQDEVSQFEQKVKDVIETFCHTYRKDANQTKIYQGLCNELVRLKADSADYKIMVIYSDFLENSTLFSLYPNKSTKYLKYPTEFADSVLAHVCPLPMLQEVDIYLVAYRTTKNDEPVNQALHFWKAILEHAGAKVTIGVDLTSML